MPTRSLSFTTSGAAGARVGRPTRITSFVPSSPGPVVMGIPVTWTVAAWGGIGSTVYKYFVYNGSTWSIGQDWSASPTWTWTPTSDGTYTFQVWVRNAGSSAEYEA